MPRCKHEAAIAALNVGESYALSVTFDRDSYYLLDPDSARNIERLFPAKKFVTETQLHYRRILVTRTA